MTIYVAFCQDRHIDPVIATFSTPEAACDFALEFMREHMAHPENIVSEDLDGYELYLSYGDEEDHAFVVETELDAKPE